MYVRREWQEHLRPRVFGWHNVQCPSFVAQDELKLRADARRYEAGTANLVGLAGLKAALEMILDIGPDLIQQELQRKRKLLTDGLQRQGCVVLNATGDDSTSGPITTFHKEGHDMNRLHQALSEAGIATSLRIDREGSKYIRLSPHFYNTDTELHRFLESV
jgi:selenocysteine lyase/cysteine desulfurase